MSYPCLYRLLYVIFVDSTLLKLLLHNLVYKAWSYGGI